MPTRLVPTSPAQADRWLDCPRAYRMRYLDRPVAPGRGGMAHLSVGSAVHLALSRWFDREPRDPELGVTLVAQAWTDEPRRDGFRDHAQSQRALLRAQGWVRDYLQRLDPATRPIGFERLVSTTTSTLALSGRVDRLDEREGAVVVVDYKTGRRPPVEGEARGSAALAAYVLGVRRSLRRPCDTVALHHLPSGTVQEHVHTQESLDRHVTRLEAVMAEATRAKDALAAGTASDAELFPPRPSARCGWCDVQQHCAEGLAAAPPVEPWAGLDEEDQ